MMQPTDHLHERIARATNRLAQLQAHELVAEQRKAVRSREAERRSQARRKRRVAELVFAARSESLPDGELVAALLRYKAECQEPDARTQARLQGERHLSSLATGASSRLH